MKWLSLVALSAVALAVAPAAQAIPVTFVTDLDGASENPPNVTPGTGQATVTFDTTAHTMRVIVTFSDLLGTTTAAHIHCCVAPPGNVGVATETPTFVDFPLGVTSGSYDHTYDMTLDASYNAPFLVANGGNPLAAELALFNGVQAGQAYLNVHSSFDTAGEIRGFLSPIPEPATIGTLGVGLIGLWLARRRTRA